MTSELLMRPLVKDCRTFVRLERDVTLVSAVAGKCRMRATQSNLDNIVELLVEEAYSTLTDYAHWLIGERGTDPFSLVHDAREEKRRTRREAHAHS